MNTYWEMGQIVPQLLPLSYPTQILYHNELYKFQL